MRFNPKARLDTSRMRDVGRSSVEAAGSAAAGCASRSPAARRPAAASAAS